jgi:glycosyltransferase involved in cell wall biosynthesis
MNASNDPPRRVYIVGPTESLLTRRGSRHPALARFLVDRGCRLEYVTSNFYHAEKRWFSSREIDDARQNAPYKLTVMRCLGYRTNISLRRVISNILLSLKFFFYLLPRVNRKTVLILPSRPVEMIFAAALLGILRRTSVALDIQDIWPDMLVVRSRLKRILFTLYCNAYLYISLRFIDKFFHVAPSFVDWLHRYHPKGKSTFVPLGFDADRWPNDPLMEEERRTGQIRLGCVAQLTFQFDIMPLLEALVDRPDVHLTLIGDDGDGERYLEVVQFIEEHGMRNVSMLGQVEPQRMGEHLQTMDLGVVPMLSSSIPNKVFDYIACYLPILVLGENDSSRLIRDCDIGWSVPYNREGVAEFLAQTDHAAILAKREKIVAVRSRFDRRHLFEAVQTLIETKN